MPPSWAGRRSSAAPTTWHRSIPPVMASPHTRCMWGLGLGICSPWSPAGLVAVTAGSANRYVLRGCRLWCAGSVVGSCAPPHGRSALGSGAGRDNSGVHTSYLEGSSSKQGAHCGRCCWCWFLCLVPGRFSRPILMKAPHRTVTTNTVTYGSEWVPLDWGACWPMGSVPTILLCRWGALPALPPVPGVAPR